jgi:hypothetical protein
MPTQASTPAAGTVQQRSPTAALLFSYRISSAGQFNAAYAEHLEWHRRQGDHLLWYGWYVIAGARTGMFVDGTFGSPFEAIDRRPNLREDAEHFAKGAALYSQPVHYGAWESWPQASTSLSLEDRAPTPFLEVLRLTVHPSRTEEFEALLSSLAARARPREAPGWAWYRNTVGQADSDYLVLIPRRSWAELAARPRSLAAMAAAAYGSPAGEGTRLSAFVRSMESELWAYRADLSYFPAADSEG